VRVHAFFPRTGSNDPPIIKAHFHKLCRIEVDLSELAQQQSKTSVGGFISYFYVVKYWVIILFNSAELRAQMAWMDGRIEKRYACTARYMVHGLMFVRCSCAGAPLP
jgi:hypothetical protein